MDLLPNLTYNLIPTFVFIIMGKGSERQKLERRKSKKEHQKSKIWKGSERRKSNLKFENVEKFENFRRSDFTYGVRKNQNVENGVREDQNVESHFWLSTFFFRLLTFWFSTLWSTSSFSDQFKKYFRRSDFWRSDPLSYNDT